MAVEQVEVAADLVAGDDFVLGVDGGGGEYAAAVVDGEDALEADVLAEVVEQVHQGGVLHWGVADAVDAQAGVVVGADDGAVLGGHDRAVGAQVVDRLLLSVPVQAGDGEGLGGGDVLGDEGADAGGEGVDLVAAVAVAAVDHGAGAVGGVGGGDSVGRVVAHGAEGERVLGWLRW